MPPGGDSPHEGKKKTQLRERGLIWSQFGYDDTAISKIETWIFLLDFDQGE